eukprot:scaffold455476_cov20-Prasinocladus_malaysianus.AAC.1
MASDNKVLTNALRKRILTASSMRNGAYGRRNAKSCSIAVYPLCGANRLLCQNDSFYLHDGIYANKICLSDKYLYVPLA